MEKEEKLMECKAPSVECILLQNRKLIKECLEVSNFMSVQLSNDNCLKDTDSQVTCILSDLTVQNQDLTCLLNILLKIKNQLTGGED